MAAERNISSSSSRGNQYGAQQPEDLKERAEDIIGEATERAGEVAPRLRDETYDMVDARREDAAGLLDRAAEKIGEPGEGMKGAAAERAAEGMHAAAGYLREHDTAQMLDDVEGYVKTHPVRSLAMAVAAGFVFSRVLR
jgi:ElaB/YqjD/DUF883 family membrane-anchored ribosome-binding protein